MARFETDSRSGAPDFTGRVAVVTGGTRGMAGAIAEAFLAAGADVVVCGRTAVRPEELPATGDPTRTGRRAALMVADIREAEQATAVIDAAAEQFGQVDVLVNNAGGSPEVEAAKASPRFINSIVALNLLAPIYCAQAANAVMQDQEEGGPSSTSGRSAVFDPHRAPPPTVRPRPAWSA